MCICLYVCMHIDISVTITWATKVYGPIVGASNFLWTMRTKEGCLIYLTYENHEGSHFGFQYQS